MAEEAKAPAAPPANEAESPGVKPIVGIILMVLTVLTSVASTAVVYFATHGHVPETVTEKDLYPAFELQRMTAFDDPPIYTLSPFSVNLGGEPARSVQIQVALHMLDESGFEEVGTKAAEAQDHVLRILSETPFDDIETIQGKLFLKQKISAAINAELEKGVIKNVYFSQFVVR